MKGIILNVVQDLVTDTFGEDMWDDLLEDAGLSGAYTSLGNYDDAELVAIVVAASARLKQSVPDVLRLVGRGAFARLAARYPGFSTMYDSSTSLLEALNDVIHPQVQVLYPGAEVPRFDTSRTGDRQLTLWYSSSRGLCHLAEGLAVGAIEDFGETATVVQEECRLEGGTECRIVVTYGDG